MSLQTVVLRYRSSLHAREKLSGVLNIYQNGIRIGSNRSLTSIRDSSFTSRTLSSTTATTTNKTLSKNSNTADSFLLEMLLTHSHWKKGQVKGISLKKSPKTG